MAKNSVTVRLQIDTLIPGNVQHVEVMKPINNSTTVVKSTISFTQHFHSTGTKNRNSDDLLVDPSKLTTPI